MYTYVISVFDELWAGIPPKFNYLPPEEVVWFLSLLASLLIVFFFFFP